MKQIIVDNISTHYYITENGECYNDMTGKYLKGQVGKNGYVTYYISVQPNQRKRIYAHRAVALAYIPNDDLSKDQVNHIDGNKLNNSIENLEWVDGFENQRHAVENELRKFDHVYCFNQDKKLVAEYKNIPEACQAVGISYSIIAQELRKDIKTLSGGFYWSREPELKEVKNYTNTGRAKQVNQYDLNGKYINTYKSTGEAARSIGIKNPSHIGECCRGKIKQYKGFIWRYVEDIVSPSGRPEES